MEILGGVFLMAKVLETKVKDIMNQNFIILLIKRFLKLFKIIQKERFKTFTCFR